MTTADELFRLAEKSHLRLVVEFNPGHDANRPGRGYTVLVGDNDTPGATEDRLDAAVSSGVLTAFRLVGSLTDELDAAKAKRAK